MNKDKAAAISLKILILIGQGYTVNKAFDKVIGEGAYEKMAGELYDEFQKRAKVNG